jgi:hypothetical protein
MAKVLISVPGDKLKRIDALARANGKSRSAYLVEAALDPARAAPARPIDDPKVRAALKVMEESRKGWKPGLTAERLVREIRDRGRY